MVIERYGMKALKIGRNIERRIEKWHACSEEIFFATQSRLYEGQLKDYGRNGLFIKTKEVLPVGEMITVVDPHPDGGNKKRKGQILWRNKEGFGVELYRYRNEREYKVIRFEKRSINSKWSYPENQSQGYRYKNWPKDRRKVHTYFADF